MQMNSVKTLSPAIRQYLLVTGNYWAFTLTDGALRMLVILYFHELGYTPLEVAMLFLFYEFFGIITNLLGGWLGAHLGLNKTMNIGLSLQVVALSMLMIPPELLNAAWVMAAQALSGIAKDLNKMSAKSSIKLLVPADAQSTLYKWVAILTGSKNALKGLGFFAGGFLLTIFGFQGAVAVMACTLAFVSLFSMLTLKKDFGKMKNKPKFTELFSKSRAVNYLSGARLFLFCARDVWFVVALPVYLCNELAWSYQAVSGFIALWIIAYGLVQTLAPRFTGAGAKQVPDGKTAAIWATALALLPAMIAAGLENELKPELVVTSGLLIFGILFAINSSLHSYLIVSFANKEGVSLDVGFYYMANAMGRLMGTVLSGWLYQAYGLPACLWLSSGFITLAALLSLRIPRVKAV